MGFFRSDKLNCCTAEGVISKYSSLKLYSIYLFIQFIVQIMIEPKLMTRCPTVRYVYVTLSSVLILPNHQHILKVWTELVPKTSKHPHVLTQLSSRENGIEFCHHETFRTLGSVSAGSLQPIIPVLMVAVCAVSVEQQLTAKSQRTCIKTCLPHGHLVQHRSHTDCPVVCSERL